MLNNVKMKQSGEPAGIEELVVPEQQSTLPGVTNRDSYLHINDDVPYFAGKDSYDNNDIVEEIASKRTQVEQSPATEDDEEGKPMASNTIARCSVQLLQQYRAGLQ